MTKLITFLFFDIQIMNFDYWQRVNQKWSSTE